MRCISKCEPTEKHTHVDWDGQCFCNHRDLVLPVDCKITGGKTIMNKTNRKTVETCKNSNNHQSYNSSSSSGFCVVFAIPPLKALETFPVFAPLPPKMPWMPVGSPEPIRFRKASSSTPEMLALCFFSGLPMNASVSRKFKLGSCRSGSLCGG